MAEEKKTNKERLREITEGIERGIQELFETDKYRQYLSTMSRFHRYSVNNTMLIYMQRPDVCKINFRLCAADNDFPEFNLARILHTRK